MKIRFVLVLAIGWLLPYQMGVFAQTISLTPTYTHTVNDAVTGDNFVNGGWYVTPGADEHENDLVRERPLSTNSFQNSENQWVHPGKYYSYLDIVSAEWGYDDNYMYFKQVLYGNWDMDDAADDRDYGVFGSGTLYNIIIGQNTDKEANGSILLRASGDNKDDTWSTFDSKTTQGWVDSNNDVGDTGITITKEEGDTAGNGYENQKIQTDGYFDAGKNPYVLFARISNAELEDNTRPFVEIALNYSTWNLYADGLGIQSIDPQDISLVVFEANRGTQDNQNYLWNDKWTIGEEGSPYDIKDENGDPINQLGNVYELDRTYWASSVPVPEPSTRASSVPVPEPSTMLLLGGGLIGLAGLGRKKFLKN